MCRGLANALPSRIRFELHSDPDAPRVETDERELRGRLALLLQHAASVLGRASGVLEVQTHVAHRGRAPGSPVAWVRVFPRADTRFTDASFEPLRVGGGGGGPEARIGMAPFAGAALPPSHLSLLTPARARYAPRGPARPA